MNKKGLLIAFEGIDGSGKSTQMPLLANWLRGLGLDVLETREPTNGPWGKRIRELYTSRARVSPEQELELFILDRQEHVRDCILPALHIGQIVLTDRYYFSTAAYQGAAGCSVAEIFRRHDFAPEPDLALLFDLPVTAGLSRIRELRGEQPNAFEQQDQLEKVAKLFASFSHQCIVRIQARTTVAEVQTSIRTALRPMLEHRGIACAV